MFCFLLHFCLFGVVVIKFTIASQRNWNMKVNRKWMWHELVKYCWHVVINIFITIFDGSMYWKCNPYKKLYVLWRKWAGWDWVLPCMTSRQVTGVINSDVVRSFSRTKEAANAVQLSLYSLSPALEAALIRHHSVATGSSVFPVK